MTMTTIKQLLKKLESMPEIKWEGDALDASLEGYQMLLEEEVEAWVNNAMHCRKRLQLRHAEAMGDAWESPDTAKAERIHQAYNRLNALAPRSRKRATGKRGRA
jgi:hypothetical protein